MFVGRKNELSQMKDVLAHPAASIIVINGKKYIGKSCLIQEFAKPFKSYTFSGVLPTGKMTALEQKNEFRRQFKEQFSVDTSADDWGDLFAQLATQCGKERIIIVLDEIAWMATGDAAFLEKLKTAWDLYFSHNPQLILILCSSVSGWVEKNILSENAILEKPNVHISLGELSLQDCALLLKSRQNNLSAYDTLKILAVTGGVPKYLELVNPLLNADDNIVALCFKSNSPLDDAFKFIFNDIYGKRSATYQEIVAKLGKAKATRQELTQTSGLSMGGDVTEYLNDLEIGGFIAKELTWDTANHQLSTLNQYRLADNYSRFYLRYIEPNLAKIKSDQFNPATIMGSPTWNSLLNLQFQNLIINNQQKLFELLALKAEDIIVSGPYFQRKTTRQKECHIDYLIQTKHDIVYACEIRFKPDELRRDMLPEVKEKVRTLKIPKYVSRRAVLIHVNGVKEDIVDEGFFAQVISFDDFLKSSD